MLVGRVTGGCYWISREPLMKWNGTTWSSCRRPGWFLSTRRHLGWAPTGISPSYACELLIRSLGRSPHLLPVPASSAWYWLCTIAKHIFYRKNTGMYLQFSRRGVTVKFLMVQGREMMRLGCMSFFLHFLCWSLHRWVRVRFRHRSTKIKQLSTRR